MIDYTPQRNLKIFQIIGCIYAIRALLCIHEARQWCQAKSRKVIGMAIHDKNDVQSIWFKNFNGDECTLRVLAGSMTRKQAGDLLDMICTARAHGTAEAGYSCVGGGFVNWSV